jgi:hypothetical protein
MMVTALWPFADVPKKMALVHREPLLPLFKSRSEASTSLRGAFYLSSWLLVSLQNVPNPAIDVPRLGPGQSAFCHAFNALPTEFPKKSEDDAEKIEIAS